MTIPQILLIKDYISEELSLADIESNKKAVRTFVRTLRAAGLISRATKLELLDYINRQLKGE